MSNDAHAILIQTNGTTWDQWAVIVHQIESAVHDSQSLFLKDDWGEEHFYVYSPSMTTVQMFEKVRPLVDDPVHNNLFSMVPACHVYHVLPPSILKGVPDSLKFRKIDPSMIKQQ